MTIRGPALSDDELVAWMRREGPMNLARAYEVMERNDLRGLVLGLPLNVFHVLGYWPQLANTKTDQPPTSFVLLSRDPKMAPGFVSSRFVYYYTYADGRFERALRTYLYGDSGDDGEAALMTDGPMFPDRALAPLSGVEARREAAFNAVPPQRRAFRDTGGALVSAMRDMGLWNGRVAYDHPAIAAVCARHDHPGQMIEGDNILRSIRIVKSDLEIALMRRASAANVEAVGLVGQAARAGASYGDLRGVYAVEAARRGNRSVFMTVDRVSSELSGDRIRDGQSLFIDGVSHFQHYHGDYARTVFVGEPTSGARRAAEAAAFAWTALREQLRPGLRYSEIVALGGEALRKAGHDTLIGFGPHSVGLMHTDEPGLEAGGFYRKADLVLQPNMILSVDCPVLDTGVGGSAHIEDLMLITENGAEPIHAIGAPVVTL